MEFSSVIPSVNLLVIKNIITEGYTDEIKRINFFYFRRIKNYRWRIHRRSISVGDVVGKLITNGICVLHRRKNSVGKTVKSCSVIFLKYFILIYFKKIILKNNIIQSHPNVYIHNNYWSKGSKTDIIYHVGDRLHRNITIALKHSLRYINRKLYIYIYISQTRSIIQLNYLDLARLNLQMQ
jgi:hypothetical protein